MIENKETLKTGHSWISVTENIFTKYVCVYCYVPCTLYYTRKKIDLIVSKYVCVHCYVPCTLYYTRKKIDLMSLSIIMIEHYTWAWLNIGYLIYNLCNKVNVSVYGEVISTLYSVISLTISRFYYVLIYLVLCYPIYFLF